MTQELLMQKLKSIYGHNFDYSLVKNAYTFAQESHRDQFRKSGHDYISHPLAVAMRLAEWRLDPATIAAAILHDVAEESPYTKEDIEKKFGSEIAFLVEGVTKLKSLRYTDAAERHAENVRKMVLALAEDIRVILIKLIDRLHNMETISFLKPEAQKRIARETIEIYAPLANRLGMGDIKGQLEDLAFPIVFPEEYLWLTEQVKEPLEARLAYTNLLIPKISEILSREGLAPSSIHARAKHYYSLWHKLRKYDNNIESIHDLVAVRIIVQTIEQCYAALGATHGEFPPLPGRIKDYIALPKSNGYRSLHTTILGPEGKIVEIQIRTKEMHDEAEGGIAAHWAYSEGKISKEKRNTLAHSRDLAWIKQLRDWHSNFQDAGEFLESLKLDFFKDRIFVFTPKGEVIDIPQGATPIDFAYHIHSDIGDQAVGVKINGKIATLDSELKNADMVEILIQKNKKPNPKWLDFVRTSIAKKHIQAATKKAKTSF